MIKIRALQAKQCSGLRTSHALMKRSGEEDTSGSVDEIIFVVGGNANTSFGIQGAGCAWPGHFVHVLATCAARRCVGWMDQEGITIDKSLAKVCRRGGCKLKLN